MFITSNEGLLERSNNIKWTTRIAVVLKLGIKAEFKRWRRIETEICFFYYLEVYGVSSTDKHAKI
jgi:hypothetical protein